MYKIKRLFLLMGKELSIRKNEELLDRTENTVQDRTLIKCIKNPKIQQIRYD